MPLKTDATKTYQVILVCNNCGVDSVIWEEVGTAVREKAQARLCERCGCQEGHRIKAR